jgi:sulfur-carrier protein
VKTIRVELPVHLRTLAGIDGEIAIEVDREPTVEVVLDALEARYPVLRGTIRDRDTRRRRAYMRYFAAGRDISHELPTVPLPPPVTEGDEVLRVLGAISGG